MSYLDKQKEAYSLQEDHEVISPGSSAPAELWGKYWGQLRVPDFKVG